MKGKIIPACLSTTNPGEKQRMIIVDLTMFFFTPGFIPCVIFKNSAPIKIGTTNIRNIKKPSFISIKVQNDYSKENVNLLVDNVLALYGVPSYV